MNTPGRVTPDPVYLCNEDTSLLMTNVDTQSSDTAMQPVGDDVVLSRGWVRNPGNMKFLRSAKRMANSYRLANPLEKVFISRLLVHSIVESSSRFIRLDKGGVGWRTASMSETLKAASRTLLFFSSKASMSVQTNQESSRSLAFFPMERVSSGFGRDDPLKDRRNPEKLNSQTSSQAETGTDAHDTALHQGDIKQTVSSRWNPRTRTVSLQDISNVLLAAANCDFPSSLQVEVGEATRDEDVRVFAKALVDSTQLRPNRIQFLHIKLSHRFNHESAKQLAVGIRRCRGLQTLQLEFNGARRKFALLLVAAAIGNSTVTSLHLDGNRMGERGALWVICVLNSCHRSNVQFISLENNAISAAGAVAVRRLLGARGRTIRTALGDGMRNDSGCFAVIPNDDMYK